MKGKNKTKKEEKIGKVSSRNVNIFADGERGEEKKDEKLTAERTIHWKAWLRDDGACRR